MDGFDLVAIATLGQTVVLTVTLIVFILQLRSQTKAIKDAAYQSVLDDYNDIVRTQVNRPEIGELLDDLVRYILHEKRWIDDASWREWATWIEVMCRNPIFTHVHTISRGMFNASFQEYLTGLMASSSVADSARSRAPKS